MTKFKDENDNTFTNKQNSKEEKEKNKENGSISTQVGGDVSKGEIYHGETTASVTINRDEYLQIYKNLVQEVNQLQLKNNLFQRRLAEYYRKRRLDHILKPVDATVELEEKYQQKLVVYEELTQKEEKELADIKSKLDAVEIQYNETLEHAKKNFDELQDYERSNGTGLIYSKKGKPISDKTVERLLSLQRRKTEQASALCLRYIRARNAVAELEAIVRKLERLGPGLYVAQYEQLNVEHQTYKNKIEEREDELIKNRNKCTEHNQMLAHIREKMHHTDEVTDTAECDLGDAEIELLRAREDLGQMKGRRDKLRWSLENERLKAGLLTRKDLLRDFQDATDEVMKLKEKKDKLERQINDVAIELRDARQRMKNYHSTIQKTQGKI